MSAEVVVIVVRLVLAAAGTEWQDIHKRVQIVIFPCRCNLVCIIQTDDMADDKRSIIVTCGSQKLSQELVIRTDHQLKLSAAPLDLPGTQKGN